MIIVKLVAAIKILFLIAGILLFQKACFNSHSDSSDSINRKSNSNSLTPNNKEWIPPEYTGLKLGKATEEDVRNAFGKPIWEGPPEEKAFGNDPEEEIWLGYENVAGVEGRTVMTIGEKTKILKAVALYPERARTREEVISEYGSDFFEIESSESMCINENYKKKEIKNEKHKYPIVLVFPNKGMYVSINNDNKADHTGFLVKCPDAM